MKKKVIFVSVLILAILGGVIIYELIKNYYSLKVYNGTAVIVESSSYSKIIAQIRDKKGRKVGNAEIYSNVFLKDDEIKVEYTKKGKNISISKMMMDIDTNNEKTNIVNHIINDPTLKKYKEMFIEGPIIEEKFKFLYALPEKISGQYYDNLISPNDFFEILKKDFDSLSFIAQDEDIYLCSSDYDFHVLSVSNIYNGSTEDINFSKLYKSFSLYSVGHGIYSVRLEFKNGDIINYIFI